MLKNIHDNQEENASNYDSSKYVTPDGVPADVAIFTIDFQTDDPQTLPKTELKILMIKRKNWPYKGSWALPGGFSSPNETLMQAAKRELKEETQIDGLHIEHLNVYSTPGRDPRKWIISSAYYALVNSERLKNREAGDDASKTETIALNDILLMKKGNPDGDEAENEGTLAFDHNEIILDAYNKIKEKMLLTDIAKEFLPKEFTLSQLYQVIKTVVPSFDEAKPNFKRKVIQRNVVEEIVGKTSNQYSKKHSQLYKFTEQVPTLSIYS